MNWSSGMGTACLIITNKMDILIKKGILISKAKISGRSMSLL